MVVAASGPPTPKQWPLFCRPRRSPTDPPQSACTRGEVDSAVETSSHPAGTQSKATDPAATTPSPPSALFSPLPHPPSSTPSPLSPTHPHPQNTKAQSKLHSTESARRCDRATHSTLLIPPLRRANSPTINVSVPLSSPELCVTPSQSVPLPRLFSNGCRSPHLSQPCPPSPFPTPHAVASLHQH